MLKHHPVFIIFLLLLIYSCSSDNDKDVSTYVVSHTNFENTLMIDGYVEPVRSSAASCPPYIEGVLAFIIEDGTYVKEGDVVANIEVQELQTNYDQLLVDLENAEANLNKIRSDLDMQYALLEAQVKNNEADTEIAQLDSLQLIYSTPNQRRIKELDLEKVTIEKNKYEKKLEALSIIQQSEIRRMELEIQNFSNRAKSAKQQIDALTVKAPQNGMAVRSTNFLTGKKLQVGDPVWHLMPLVTLPDFSEMKVKIMAPEIDYKYISVNDSVFFTFDAMPGNMAWGKILMKSPVGKQHKEGSKVKFFEIEASIDSTLTMPEPGFTADCRIILKQVKDTIVVPQIAIFEEDSMKVVYVKKKRGFERRQVQTGLSSPKEAIVAAGLQGKEIISLAKPQASSVKKTVLLPVIPDSTKVAESDSVEVVSDSIPII